MAAARAAVVARGAAKTAREAAAEGVGMAAEMAVEMWGVGMVVATAVVREAAQVAGMVEMAR